MSIIKNGKNYGVETKTEIKDEFRDQLFSQTLEEIHSTTPIKSGQYLFANQPNLRIADIVLSDKLTETSQYTNMFKNCSSLTQAPDLPATTLVSGCYQNMFDGCSSLTEAPALPAIKAEVNCYSYMFSGCSSLTQAPDLPATTLGYYCYSYMFSGCSSLTQAPDLPATRLVSSCYEYMFRSCSSLQKTGIISAEGNISNNATYMFRGCSSLKETTWTSTTPPTISSTMFYNCPSDMIIYVPDESVDAYKSASVWSSRAEYIKPISEKPTE